MLHLIYNPVAGKGRCARVQRVLQTHLRERGVSHQFHATQKEHDARHIAHELTLSAETDIVAMGGDGTLCEVLNGLCDPARVTLGLIPCGSGNDFAAAAGIPTDPLAALDVLLDCPPKFTDYLNCSGVRGLNIIGTGIDVEILQRARRARFLSGSLNYFVSLLVSLIPFRQYRFTSDRDGRQGVHQGLIVCACNGQRLGGGIPICPDAALDDGLVNVVIVQDVRKALIPKALIALMRGRILRKPYTLHERASHLRAVFSQPVTVQVDGELYESLPFDVRVITGELKMRRP